MRKIKEWFNTQKHRIGGVGKKYLATLCLTFLLCAFYDFLLISDTTINRNEEYILIFLGMSIVGTFFTESVLRGRKSKEVAITGYIFSGLGAFLWVILDVIAQSDVSDITKYYILVAAGFYVLVFVSLSFLALVKDSNLAFEQYLLRIVISVLKLLLILLILNLGVLLILWLIDALIAKIYIFTWLGYVEIMLVALVYIPYGLSCLINQSEPEQTKFARGLVLYALMPLLIAATGIVYIYIGKIVITRDIPSNQVFMICAGLCFIGWLIWTMAYAYTRRDRTPIYNKIIRYMKYFYAPLIILEIYAIAVRIHDYGYTIPRLAGIAFIVLQVIYMAWEPIIFLIRRIFRLPKVHYAEHYEWLLYVILGIYVFATIIPWTSFVYIEANSQEARFEENWAAMQKMREIDRELTPDEYQEVARLQYSGKSIRRVLEVNIYGVQYLRLNYNEAELEEALSMDDTWWKSEEIVVPEQEPIVDEWSVSQYLSGGMDILTDGLKIENYSRLYEATMYSAVDLPMEWSELRTIQLQYGLEQTVTVDITNCVDRMTDLYEEAVARQLGSDDEEPDSTETPRNNTATNSTEAAKEISVDDMEQMYQIPVDGGVYTITSISFRYNPATKQIRNLTLMGYIMFP